MLSGVTLLIVFTAVEAAAQIAFVPLPFRPPGSAGAPVAADFNADGKMDLAVLEQATTATVSGTLYLGKGDGTFQPGKPFGSAHGDLLVTGDFNGDGRPDLAMASYAGGTITIFLGKGDGTFQPSGSFQAASGLTAICAGDWNGDHKTDLAVLDRSASSLIILQSQGDGTFTTAATYTIPFNSVNQLTAADFNGDGKLDLAVVSGIVLGPASEGDLSVFLGNGDGTFHALSAIPVASGANFVVAADFNRDGKTDLAITGFGGFPTFNTQIQIWLGDGTGKFSRSFATPDAYSSTGLAYFSFAVADVGGDGKPDLLTILNGGIGYLAGNGDGTFQPALSVIASVTGAGLLADDFNGDGKPDAATADTVYLNASTATHIVPGGVVSAASFQAPALVPGSLISIFGSGLASGNPPAPRPGLLYVDGTAVTINGTSAPLLYVSPSQINAQVPWELAGSAQASFATTVSGFPGQTVSLPVPPVAPGIFTVDAAGYGAVLIAAPGNPIPAPLGQLAGSRPVNRGEWIQIFGTGFGPVTNQPATGAVSPSTPLAGTLDQPSVDIGGASAQVSFSGLAPTLIGLYQVNALVPAGAPSGGAVPLRVSIAGSLSNTVLIAVQ